MTTTLNTRRFLREFADIKAKAQAGDVFKIVDHGAVYIFQSETVRAPLLGLASGVISQQCPDEDLFSTGEAWEAER